MDFKATIEVNKEIMALIKSKYPDDFPIAYHNVDATYYNRLADELCRAEAYLDRAEVKTG